MNDRAANSDTLSPAAAAARGACVLALPAELGQNDTHLHVAVGRLLDQAPVRAVTIDRERRAAIVQLHPTHRHSDEVAALPDFDWRSASAGGAAPGAEMLFWSDPRDRSMSFIKLPARARGWRRLLLLATAALALVLSVLGIVLPGLPTTPFVLVASYCLVRSSPRWHARLLESRLFGGVLRDWHLHRGLRPHVRYKAIAVIALVVGASLCLTSLPLVAKAAIAVIALVGVSYIFRLPDVRG